MGIVLERYGSVQQYLDAFGALLSEVPRECPGCGAHALKGHGSYARRIRLLDGECRVPIRRLRCSACGRTFSLRPAFVVERSRFAREVHDLATERSPSVGGAEIAARGRVVSLSTLRRWLRAA